MKSDALAVLVLIVKAPAVVIDGVSLARYRVGQTYDVPPVMADFLVLHGYARLEMRRGQRSRRARPTDRRRTRG